MSAITTMPTFLRKQIPSYALPAIDRSVIVKNGAQEVSGPQSSTVLSPAKKPPSLLM